VGLAGFGLRGRVAAEWKSMETFPAGVSSSRLAVRDARLRFYSFKTMTNQPEQCYECGCQGDASEFQRKRVRQPKRSGKGKLFVHVFFCPSCAAKNEEQLALARGRRCEQCGARIKAGEAQLRSKTETEVLGAVARHETVHMILCPACAENYDGTGNHLLKGMLWFIGAVVCLVVASLLFSRK
jgi:hypothetical protein